MHILIKLRIYFLILILAGTFVNTLAAPIAPRPLRILLEESENVVIGYVYRIEKLPDNFQYYDRKAILLVKDVLQGNIKKDTIQIYFSGKFICPLPAQYIESTNVLVFPKKRENMDGYTTHALSYGAKTISDKGVELYKARIREMQEIRNITDEKEKQERIMDWLITCIGQPETRWEGVYELYPHGDFMTSYCGEEVLPNKRYELNNEQKSKLRKYILAQNPVEFNDIELVELIQNDNDKELKEFLIKCIKASAEYNFWYAGYMMEKIALFTNRQDLKLISDKMKKLNPVSEGYSDEVKKIVQEYIIEM